MARAKKMPNLGQASPSVGRLWLRQRIDRAILRLPTGKRNCAASCEVKNLPGVCLHPSCCSRRHRHCRRPVPLLCGISIPTWSLRLARGNSRCCKAHRRSCTGAWLNPKLPNTCSASIPTWRRTRAWGSGRKDPRRFNRLSCWCAVVSRNAQPFSRALSLAHRRRWKDEEQLLMTNAQ